MQLQLLYLLLVYYVLYFASSDAKSVDSITSHDVESALKRASEKVEEEEQLKRDLIAQGKFLDRSVISAEARHQLPVENVGNIVKRKRAQSILEAATIDLVSRFGLRNDDMKKLSDIPLDGEIGRQVALECSDNRPTNCNQTSIYRTIDGSCNNLERPNQGRTFGCFQRLIRPDYEDGVSAPRTQNGNLPEPRQVTIAVHRIVPEDRQIDEPQLSALHMSWGQFLDHDIELGAQPTTENNTAIQCCLNSGPLHPQCLPITIAPDDPDFNRTCMNFVRDAPCPHCNISGERQQINTLSTYIDGSHIYGSTEQLATSLRSPNNDGKLLSTMISDVGERPPPSDNPNTDQCSRPGFPCFRLGDIRANQNPWLLSLHIIHLIFHNQIATKLSTLNPQWDGEKIYQEARRIVAACFQHISYNEYLRLVVGDEVMDKFYLYTDDSSTRYDNSCNPELYNVFAAAGFRFAHSTVPDYVLTLTENNAPTRLELRDYFFNPTPMYESGTLEDIIRGSVRQPQQFFDNYAVRAVTEYLYRRLNVTAMDLASINIQRGRERGLPGYIAFVERIHNFRINSFQDLVDRRLMTQRTVDVLSNLYRSVDDIDPWTGFLCERHYNSALVGQTTRYLIGKQFYLIKYCDRFFYTHAGEVGSFTRDQLNSIKDITLARIICDTLKLPEISEAPFEYSSPILFCNNTYRIPELNLYPWKEQRKRRRH